MSDPVDRRTILGASLAWAALALSGCSDNGGASGSGGAHGSGGASGSGGGQGTGGGSGSGGAQASGGSPGSGGTQGSGGTNGSGGAQGSGGTSGSGGAQGSGGADGSGGTGGAGSGGEAGSGGTAIMCMTTMTGTHTHPLMIPGSDIDRGSQEAPYVLEDGGTGHMHTLELSLYDFAYLHAGATRMIDSSKTADHIHTVTVVCTVP